MHSHCDDLQIERDDLQSRLDASNTERDSLRTRTVDSGRRRYYQQDEVWHDYIKWGCEHSPATGVRTTRASLFTAQHQSVGVDTRGPEVPTNLPSADTLKHCISFELEFTQAGRDSAGLLRADKSTAVTSLSEAAQPLKWSDNSPHSPL
ncbi:hypothetical protein OBBRIDRAFT_807845 [Obba rivulosa]|uniref:Uncharacterized protein n=1 Tax=Obba rivulosa TaxID=1052685 RepID=A0A8E2AIW3_9APHY|nr:hypothetical protein OBBRIDRAFT_807845 [Obba rivulosa]